MDKAKEELYNKLVDNLVAQKVNRLADFDRHSITAVEAEVLARRIETDEIFEQAWFRNYSRQYYEYIATHLDKNTENSVLQKYIGKQGAGKSFASLFNGSIQHDFFDMEYKIVWSKLEASAILALEQYKQAKNGIGTLKNVTLLIDEVQKNWGIGSMADEVYFQQSINFLRKNRINMNIVSITSDNSIHSVPIELEVVGYTRPISDGTRYTKAMLYWQSDARNNNTWQCLGYVLTKTPPKIYLETYNSFKDSFLNDFQSNKSTKVLRDKSLLAVIWDSELTEKDKETIRVGITLGRKEVNTFLREKFRVFNFPEAVTDELIEMFKWEYYEEAIMQNWKNAQFKLNKLYMENEQKYKNPKNEPIIIDEIKKEKVRDTNETIIKSKEEKENKFSDLVLETLKGAGN